MSALNIAEFNALITDANRYRALKRSVTNFNGRLVLSGLVNGDETSFVTPEDVDSIVDKVAKKQAKIDAKRAERAGCSR